MKTVAMFILGAAMGATILAAQTKNDVQTILLARGGFRSGTFTYRYFETFQERGRWVYPDVGYIDFGNAGHYREFFIGAGGSIWASKHFQVIEEGLIEQATGPRSEGATYLVPWSYVPFNVTTKLGGEIVYFPYLPLNKAGRIQHVLERAKLEYDFRHFKAGGGYGAYQFASGPWEDKPFVTTTLKAGRLGNFEFWLQRLPSNRAQLQIRYARVFN